MFKVIFYYEKMNNCSKLKNENVETQTRQRYITINWFLYTVCLRIGIYIYICIYQGGPTCDTRAARVSRHSRVRLMTDFSQKLKYSLIYE